MGMEYLYLHGFASAPASSKAQFLRSHFSQLGLTLHVPDMNLGDFSSITITKQLHFLVMEYGDRPLAVIGSSLGGFLAAHFAAIETTQVKKLMLLAPAFQFSNLLAQALGAELMLKWQREAELKFYHYGSDRQIPLQYKFWLDASSYQDPIPTSDLPILIMHGIHDDVIPARLSEEFASKYANVKLKLINSDHRLADPESLAVLWQNVRDFLEL
jgi:pimeloyl-ACP methyl ester carboxylesterase